MAKRRDLGDAALLVLGGWLFETVDSCDYLLSEPERRLGALRGQASAGDAPVPDEKASLPNSAPKRKRGNSPFPATTLTSSESAIAW